MPTLYVTAPPDAVDELASGLVEQRLAACVNVLECRSVYRWEDSVHDEHERVLLVKTTDDGTEQCWNWIEDHHPYDVPCIERYDADDVLPEFAAWREDVVE